MTENLSVFLAALQPPAQAMDPQQPQPQIPLPQLSRDDKKWLSRQYHRRVKTATRAVLGITVVSCLLFDWDTYLGTDKHIFRGIRPGIRKALDSIYGIPPEQPPSRRDA